MKYSMLLTFVQQNNNVKILPIFVRSIGDSDGRGLCTDGCSNSGVDGCSDVVVDGIVGSTIDGGVVVDGIVGSTVDGGAVADGAVVIGDVVFGSGSGIFDCAAVIDGVVVVVFAAVVVVVVVVVDGAAVVDGPVVP